MIPGLPWPAAIALGAIVAPPDAAAATTVLRQLRPPHRLLVILGGESLFNDASALLIYRFAVGAAVTGSFQGWSAVPTFFLVAVGSTLLGVVLARPALYATARIRDVPTAVIVQFLTTFAVWMLADRLGLSGIIAVVVFAILVARTAPDQMPARLRIQSYAVWDVAVFVLNVLAFILIGLQLKPILQRLGSAELARYAAAAAVVIATVMIVRIVWVMLYAAVARWGGAKLSLRNATVVAWCGMRGIVTLATALALPTGGDGTQPFPFRDFILFTAFSVVLGTLVVQGLTLRPLMQWLGLRDDGSVDREVRLARAETTKAGLAALSAGESDGEMIGFLRRKYEARLQRAQTPEGEPDPADSKGWREFHGVQRRAQEEERRILSDLRARGVIGDDAFHQVEEELDWAEVSAQARSGGDRDTEP
jgi:CPA1 family monovalent cation:H+ antiporter